MKPIEIDLDVHRFIEAGRMDFDETPNTILRRLLGIEKMDAVSSSPKLSVSLVSKKMMSEAPEKNFELSDEISNYQSAVIKNRISASEAQVQRDWIYGGARLSEGAKLRKWSTRQKHDAVIHNGSIFINGQYHQSPSSAAMAVNGRKSVNGWNFWEYFDESETRWKKLDLLREGDYANSSSLDFNMVTTTPVVNADSMFMQELPPVLKEIGNGFLNRIREFHKGALQYHPKSKKFVENPNFYTVTIQPRDGSLRISVYGNPQDFNHTTLELSSGMNGYSTFKISSLSQLDETIKVIQQAREWKLGKS